MKRLSKITEYHGHVYFHDPVTKSLAAGLRKAINSKFDVCLGKWHYTAVGPHPLPMYQISFSDRQFGNLIPWLMLYYQGLSVLIHPETSNQIEDHSKHCFWFGARLSLIRRHTASITILPENTAKPELPCVQEG